jgi:hypothetical protein
MKRILLLLCLVSSPVLAQQRPEKPQTPAECLDALEAFRHMTQLRLSSLDDLTSTLYARLDCDNGVFGYLGMKGTGLTFLVACTKLEPYLEGYRLSLSVGNPYSLRFDSHRNLYDQQ